MHLTYDQLNQLEKRTWTDTSPQAKYPGSYKAIPVFDENGLLIEEKYYYQGVKESTMSPFVTIKYHYYDPQNIDEVLENEQIIRVGE